MATLRPRVALRTALMLMTLPSCAGFWLSREVASKHREESALKHLARFEVTMHYVSVAPWWLDWLVHDRVEVWKRTRTVNIARGSPTDHDFKRISDVAHLQELSFSGEACGDKTIDYIKQIPLRSLSILWSSSVTARGVAQLSQMRSLESLTLESDRVTDDGLAPLTKLPRLRHLSLRGQLITDRGIMPFAAMPHLQVLDLRWTKVTKEGAEAVHRANPKIIVKYGGA